MKKLKIFTLLFISLCFILSGILLCENIKGVKVYNYSKDLNKLFKEFKSIGINTVFAGEELAKNKDIYTIAKKHNIKTFIVFPVFCSPGKPFENSNLYAINGYGKKAFDEWVHFACPSNANYRKNKTDELKKIIKKYNPDGISIDFIRYFVYWEKVFADTKIDPLNNTCFCTNCIVKFKNKFGFTIPDKLKTTSEKANYILTNHLKEWVIWKTNIITSMVKELVKTAKSLNHNILINAHIVPWRAKDFNNGLKLIAGQNINEISKHVDYISPMCYWHMLKRPANWINSVVKDMAMYTSKPILPSIQVNKSYLKKPITIKMLKESYFESLKKPSSGIIFWKWGFFEDQAHKKKIFSIKNNSKRTKNYTLQEN